MDTLTYTSLRENLADALEKAEKGETLEITRRGHKSVYLVSSPDAKIPNDLNDRKQRFNAALNRVQKEHAEIISALADR